jgi:hypothetical protein
VESVIEILARSASYKVLPVALFQSVENLPPHGRAGAQGFYESVSVVQHCPPLLRQRVPHSMTSSAMLKMVSVVIGVPAGKPRKQSSGSSKRMLPWQAEWVPFLHDKGGNGRSSGGSSVLALLPEHREVVGARLRSMANAETGSSLQRAGLLLLLGLAGDRSEAALSLLTGAVSLGAQALIFQKSRISR